MVREIDGYRFTSKCTSRDSRTESYWIEFEGGEIPPDEILEKIVMSCGIWQPTIIKHPEKSAVGCTGWVD